MAGLRKNLFQAEIFEAGNLYMLAKCQIPAISAGMSNIPQPMRAKTQLGVFGSIEAE